MAATVLETQKKKTRLMTEGSIWKNILLFSVPLILGNLLQQLYNTADSIIVGNFLGSNALAAVGSSGSPIYLLIGFSQGIAVGAGVPVGASVSSASGQEKVIREKRSIRQSSRVMRRMVMHLRQKQFRVFIIPHLRADVNLRNVTLPFRGKL